MTLIQVLDHPDAKIRSRIITAMRILGSSKAIQPLKRLMESEDDAQVMISIISTLDFLTANENQSTGKPQPQSRVERLIDHLSGEDTDIAIQAVNSLAEIRDMTIVPQLILTFRNRKRPPSVRLAVANALLALGSAPSEVTLLAALRSSKWNLRRNGAAILGHLKADWAVKPLAEALHDTNHMVSMTAQSALRRIATPEARQILLENKKKLAQTTRLDPSALSDYYKRPKQKS